MKIRMQICLGLLMITTIFSLIAVSLGWYAAEQGKINFKSTSVTVTSSDNTYGVTYKVAEVGLAKVDNGAYSIITSNKSPYLGESGLGNERYIIIYKFIDEKENVVSRSATDLYVSKSTVTAPNENLIEVNYTKDQKSTDFVVTCLNYDETTQTYIENKNVTNISYFAIEFKANGENPFKYSDSSYKGSSFELVLTLVENKNN